MVFHHGNGVKDGVTESNGATCRSEYLLVWDLKSCLLPYSLARTCEVLLASSESEGQTLSSTQTSPLLPELWSLIQEAQPLKNILILWKAALYSAKQIFTLLAASCGSQVSKLSLKQYIAHNQCLETIKNDNNYCNFT